MASHDLSSAAGQGQLRRDEHSSHPSNPSSQSAGGPQDQSYTTQATNFLQQTGEQMKTMAQGAAEAMKNTLGMNADNSNNPSNNPANDASNHSHPGNLQPTGGSYLSNNPNNNPSNLSHPSNPAGGPNPSTRI